MAFVDIFNYKKYFSNKGDSNVARIGHVNKLATRITNPIAITQLTDVNTAVTVDAYAGVITLAGILPAPPASVSFPVTNSLVTADSTVLLTIDYSSTADLSDVVIYGIGRVVDGEFTVILRGGPTGSPIKIHFLVVS